MDYKNLFAQKIRFSSDYLLHELSRTRSWEDVYWLGKCADLCEDPGADKAKIDIITTSFNLGLNIHSNRMLYLDSVQRISRLYFVISSNDK